MGMTTHFKLTHVCVTSWKRMGNLEYESRDGDEDIPLYRGTHQHS